ncbi:MAG TPA: LLM class F420-dependent oxidoreductase, partial [Candidatus Binataceae bacterium]|nr:LLM class F420-dependent oxidoreductase [Candidatus Binataceae bacterium]
MKIGLLFSSVVHDTLGNARLFAHLVTTAERCGIESLWTPEHVAIPQHYQSRYPYGESGKHPTGEDRPILDPFLPLGYAAALTSKIKLGQAVLILPQHHPLYIAKQIATLDILSEGRAMLGAGVGWLKEEYDSLGIDFHTRGARMDESIRAIRELWSDQPCTFIGEHFNFGPLKSLPKPLQGSRVPIHIGGHSKAAVRRAVRLADGLFPAGGDPAAWKEMLDLMRSKCAKIGRNPAEIEISVALPKVTLDEVKRAED